MVTHMSRKRRSKRHMKRYSKHSKTHIKRNMYRKKHKKTQRGGVLQENYTLGVALPEGWERIPPKNEFEQTVYKDPDGKLHLDHPNPNASNAEARIRLDSNLDVYSYSELDDLYKELEKKCNDDLKIISDKKISKMLQPTPQFISDSNMETTNFSKSKEAKLIHQGKLK